MGSKSLYREIARVTRRISRILGLLEGFLGLFGLQLSGLKTEIWVNIIGGIGATFVIYILTLVLRGFGFFREKKPLQREDVVEVVDKVFEERMCDLPSLTEFSNRLAGKNAVVCPRCEAWNLEATSICRGCKSAIYFRGASPAKVPLLEVFEQLREYYSGVWGKYSDTKLNNDLIGLGISPEESVLTLAEVIKKKVKAA